MKRILNSYFYKIIAASLLLAACAFCVSQYNHYKDLRNGYLGSAQRISHAISARFSFFYHNVQNIAFNRSVRLLNSRHAGEYFDSLVALYPYYDVILLTDMKGRFIASNSIGAGGEALETKHLKSTTFPVPGESPRYSEELSKGFLGTEVKAFSLDQPISKMYGYDKYGMALSATVYSRKGNPLGRVSTFINQDWLQKDLARLSAGLKQVNKSAAGIYLLNKDKKVIAANVKDSEEEVFLKNLPFEIKTANFSLHAQEGNLEQGIKGLKRFFSEPFFIISKFHHQEFLSSLGWSLVVKMGKENAFFPMVESLIWFAGAALIFLVFAYVLKLKAVSEFEKSVQLAPRDESSFKDFLASAEAESRLEDKEIWLQVQNLLSEIKEKANFEIERAALEEIPSGIKFDALAEKARGGFHGGLIALQSLDSGRASLERHLSINHNRESQIKDALNSFIWNMEKANSLMDDLRASALNAEVKKESGSSDDLLAGRQLDTVSQDILLYFGEAKRCSGLIEKLSKANILELARAWESEERNFDQKIEDAREGFGRAQIASDEMGAYLIELEARGAEHRRERFAKLSEADKSLSELKEKINEIENLLEQFQQAA